MPFSFIRMSRMGFDDLIGYGRDVGVDSAVITNNI